MNRWIIDKNETLLLYFPPRYYNGFFQWSRYFYHKLHDTFTGIESERQFCHLTLRVRIASYSWVLKFVLYYESCKNRWKGIADIVFLLFCIPQFPNNNIHGQVFLLLLFCGPQLSSNNIRGKSLAVIYHKDYCLEILAHRILKYM